jgi:hypothetical protein
VSPEGYANLSPAGNAHRVEQETWLGHLAHMRSHGSIQRASGA